MPHLLVALFSLMSVQRSGLGLPNASSTIRGKSLTKLMHSSLPGYPGPRWIMQCMVINLKNYSFGANLKLNVGYGAVFRESLPGRLPTATIVHLLTASRSVTVGPARRSTCTTEPPLAADRSRSASALEKAVHRLATTDGSRRALFPGSSARLALDACW